MRPKSLQNQDLIDFGNSIINKKVILMDSSQNYYYPITNINETFCPYIFIPKRVDIKRICIKISTTDSTFYNPDIDGTYYTSYQDEYKEKVYLIGDLIDINGIRLNMESETSLDGIFYYISTHIVLYQDCVNILRIHDSIENKFNKYIELYDSIKERQDLIDMLDIVNNIKP